MRIERLELRNVRVLASFAATLAPGFNMIVGENGSGKSTILTMVARILSQWTRGPMRLLRLDDERMRVAFVEGNPTKVILGDATLSVSGLGGDGDAFAMHEEIRSIDARLADHQIKQRAASLLKRADRDMTVLLPVLAFFSPWREPPREGKPTKRFLGPQRRTDGYLGAFDLKADAREFAVWFKAMEQERQDGKIDRPSLEVARQTVIDCLPGVRDIRYFPGYDDILLCFEDGRWESYWKLSDGFRTMLALIGELAWRAVMLNPTMGGRIAKDVTGIVLIDEIDLHLHPRWQRRVVADLRRAFPKIQFIATTHSPFIVQSMRREEVINLDGHAEMNYWQEGIEDIATQSMGVTDGGPVLHSQRYRELEVAAQEYYTLLETANVSPQELAQRKERLDAIELEFIRDPALAALLKMRRMATEAQT